MFHEYTDGGLPDGLAFGASGLPLCGSCYAVRLGRLDPGAQWCEVARLTNPPGSPIYPYDSPANIAFDGKGSILLTNHALFTGATNPGQFSGLEVFVNDRGSPLDLPIIR